MSTACNLGSQCTQMFSQHNKLYNPNFQMSASELMMVRKWLIVEIKYVVCRGMHMYIALHQFTMADWLKHSPATPGDGLVPQLRRYFISRIYTVSSTDRLEMVCVAWQKLTATCNVGGDNW